MENTATTLPLRDGAVIPADGPGRHVRARGHAPRADGRSRQGWISPATVCRNQGEVGEGLRSLDLDRSEVFVTTGRSPANREGARAPSAGIQRFASL